MRHGTCGNHGSLQAPPPGKEVDIGAHHIVMMYLEKYMTVTFSYSGGLFSVFKAAKEFSKMRNVQVSISSTRLLTFSSDFHACKLAPPMCLPWQKLRFLSERRPLSSIERTRLYHLCRLSVRRLPRNLSQHTDGSTTKGSSQQW